MAEARFALSSTLLLIGAFACTATWAQSAPQTASAASAAERAQAQTDRTMYWIRILADKPAPAKAAAAATPKAVAAAGTAPAPAAKPVTEAREKVRVAAATPTAANPATGGAARTSQAQEPARGSFPEVPDPTRLPAPVDNPPTAANAALPPASELMPAPAAEPDPGLVQIKSVQPEFPGPVVLRVRKGNVEVRFEVEPDGTVSDAVAVQSSNARLNAAAVEAVKQWRFKPGPRGHTAAVNLVFDIDNEK